MTATATAEVLTTITLRNVFRTIILTLTATTEDVYTYPVDATAPGGHRVEVAEGTVYRVEGVSLYGTTKGGVVEGTRECSFGDLADAKGYANGWFATLTRKGWERVA